MTQIPRARLAFILFVIVSVGTIGSRAQVATCHQIPDEDGIYYAGPEVSAPRLMRTALAPYPADTPRKSVQGISVFAMVINAKGIPEHIELLHTHGENFDRAAQAAIGASVFKPGSLGGQPVPVWIDVRVVFRSTLKAAIPEVLITERDLPCPTEEGMETKHHRQRPLPYTAPIPIHTVDADFADPFVEHPYVQVAIVTVLVSETGLPKEVQIFRGLGFGLDQKAAAAVWHYRFLPATKDGRAIAARRNVEVAFAKF
jgi:Gram-negative bacterial TonB protein C-terminal